MPCPVPDLDTAQLERVRQAARILALRALGDGDAAEEAAQETVVRLIETVRAGRWRREEGSLGAFACGIARHVITDALRRQGRVVPLPAEVADLAARDPDPLDQLVSDGEAARLREALAFLAPADHELLRLSYFEGLSSGEIALRLREPGPRIRKRKSRALDRLRAAFFAAGHAAAPPANALVEGGVSGRPGRGS